MRDTDIAYIAGVIDGEGYIGIKKAGTPRADRRTPGYIAMVQVKMVDEPAIRFLAETLGGWYYLQKPSARKGRPLYCWQVSHKAADTVLLAVLPYLRVKRQSAETVLQFRELQAQSTQHRTKVVGYRDFTNQHGTVRRVANKAFSDEYVAQCDALWQRCKNLNHVGI